MNIIEAAHAVMSADEELKFLGEDGLALVLNADGFLVYALSSQYARIHVSDLLSEKWTVVDE